MWGENPHTSIGEKMNSIPGLVWFVATIIIIILSIGDVPQDYSPSEGLQDITTQDKREAFILCVMICVGIVAAGCLGSLTNERSGCLLVAFTVITILVLSFFLYDKLSMPAKKDIFEKEQTFVDDARLSNYSNQEIYDHLIQGNAKYNLLHKKAISELNYSPCSIMLLEKVHGPNGILEKYSGEDTDIDDKIIKVIGIIFFGVMPVILVIITLLNIFLWIKEKINLTDTS